MMEDDAVTDGDLVRRTQSSDPTAFDDLFRRFSPRIYGLVYNMTGNQEDANDLVQEIFAKAYRSIRGFKQQSSFATWIHTIAVNMTINFLKKRGRRTTLSLDDETTGLQNDSSLDLLVEKNNPEREANLRDLKEKLNAAMLQLSHTHRAVVTMFDIQGMPHAEIAKIMGTSEGTVRSRLFYAHRQLQALLGEFLDNPSPPDKKQS